MDRSGTRNTRNGIGMGVQRRCNRAAQGLAIACVTSLLLVLVMIGHDVAAAMSHGREVLVPASSIPVERTPHAWSETDTTNGSFDTELPTIEQCVTTDSGVISTDTPAREHGHAALLAFPGPVRFERQPLAATAPRVTDPDARRALMQIWLN